MADVPRLTKQWQKALAKYQKQSARSEAKAEVYDKKIAAANERISKRHGIARIKNPFTRGITINHWHKKQNKLALKVDRSEMRIDQAADKILNDLGGADAIKGTPYEKDYGRVQEAIAAVTKTRRTVRNAARFCTASGWVEYMEGNGKRNDIPSAIATAAVAGASALNVKRVQRSLDKLKGTLGGLGQQKLLVPNTSKNLVGDIVAADANALLADTLSDIFNNGYSYLAGWFGGARAGYTLRKAGKSLRNTSYSLDHISRLLIEQKIAMLETAVDGKPLHPTVKNDLLPSMRQNLPGFKPQT